jgi:hypothetical protein
MIGESRYYKDDLLTFAHDVERWLSSHRFTERRWYEFERGLLSSMLAVRRLTECSKIADDLATSEVSLQAYRPTGKTVHRLNHHDIQELYDIEHPTRVNRPLAFVVNQMIHSFVLNYWIEERRKGITIFFSSDRERHKAAYSIATQDLFPILRLIGSDYPDTGNFTYNEAKRGYDFTLATTKRKLRGAPRNRRPTSR